MDTDTDTATQRSARGRSSRRKGASAERDVARYLREHGFPHAERAVRTGYTTAERHVADPLDLTGTPGLLWSVKDDARNEVGKWLDEAETARAHADADLAVLVVKRRGKSSPAFWWAWLPFSRLISVLTGEATELDGGDVCMTLAALVALLRESGYGDDEIETGAA